MAKSKNSFRQRGIDVFVQHDGRDLDDLGIGDLAVIGGIPLGIIVGKPAAADALVRTSGVYRFRTTVAVSVGEEVGWDAVNDAVVRAGAGVRTFGWALHRKTASDEYLNVLIDGLYHGTWSA